MRRLIASCEEMKVRFAAEPLAEDEGSGKRASAFPVLPPALGGSVPYLHYLLGLTRSWNVWPSRRTALSECLVLPDSGDLRRVAPTR